MRLAGAFSIAAAILAMTATARAQSQVPDAAFHLQMQVRETYQRINTASGLGDCSITGIAVRVFQDRFAVLQPGESITVPLPCRSPDREPTLVDGSVPVSVDQITTARVVELFLDSGPAGYVQVGGPRAIWFLDRPTLNPAAAGGDAAAERPIGTAMLQEDGTLVVDLYPGNATESGTTQLIYPPNDSQYATMIAHVGGIRQGEVKQVPPFRRAAWNAPTVGTPDLPLVAIPGAELASMIRGNTVSGIDPRTDPASVWTYYFDTSGALAGARNGMRFAGRWTLRGDQVCVAIGGEPSESCMEFRRSAVTMKAYVGGGVAGTDVSVRQGNSDGL